MKHFGALYGVDFARRNARRLYEKLQYHGAYIADKLVAACYSFNADSILFLHADESDTPKDMYLKMGFQITDRLYEYGCYDLNLYQGTITGDQG